MASHAAPKKVHSGRRTRRALQILAIVVAGLLVPIAAVAATATSRSGSSASEQNLSTNSVLASGLQGYSIQEGGKGLQRVAVSDHVSASWAARVTSTARTTRVAEPAVSVRAGETWSFAADVKGKSGARAHITVSWFAADGRFLSYTSAPTTSVNRSTWTRVAATLPVPGGAATARTVVNVLGTARSATVQVTQHDVRAPVVSASGTPTTAPSTSNGTSSAAPSSGSTASSSTSAPSTTGSTPASSTPSTTAPSTTAPSTTAPSTPTTGTTTSSAPASGSSSTSTTGTVTNLPAQAAGIFYGGSSGATAYAHPGGLVVAGRDNYQDQAFRTVSAGGGSVLIYIDAIIDNAHGRYHDMLINASACGPATSRWPGNYQANEWGFLNDFRVGSVLQSKFRCVLETMVAENPHMAGFFADDLGSRSWYPGIDWRAFPDKAGYRAGAIALSQTLRSVADAHGLVFLVNGTWSANDGGGYPNVAQSGNALADGGFVEHHDGQIEYFGPYGCSPQWAAQSPITRGRAINYAVTNTAAGRTEYVNSGCYAYVHQQATYDGVAPWGTFHPTGLPSRVRY